MMVNRETCNVRSFFTFLQRQLLTVRLNNPWWWSVLWPLDWPPRCLDFHVRDAWRVRWSRPSGWPPPGWWRLLVVYWVSMVLLLMPMEWCVRRIVRREPSRQLLLAWGDGCGSCLAIPMTQIIYPAGLLSTCFIGTHLWRGVRYDFRGPSPVA